MTDERYKKIMADLGMPNSRSLLVALQQVANEAGQECAAAEREACAKTAEDLPACDPDGPWFNDEMTLAAIACAEAIRMRSNVELTGAALAASSDRRERG